MNRSIRLLMVEDSPDDALFVLEALRKHGYAPLAERVETRQTFLAALEKGNWDLVIADYSMPQFGGVEALRLLRQRDIDLPFIIVSGTIGEEVAVAAMKLGAHDYLLKDKLARLAPAVERELKEAKTRRKHQAAEDELRRSREQLRALAAHLQHVREEERKVIAREIHDELGQSLTAFKMDLAWVRNRLMALEDSPARQPILDKVKAIGTAIDGSANLVRKLCTELRPGILDDIGLLPAIEWQAQEFQRRTGIECEMKVEVPSLELDSERSTAFFRIFQEIMTNVARHAKATRVQARIRKMGDEIVLEVQDNGRGIEENELTGTKSFGLLGMRERVLLFGGEVSIHGKRGKGTNVTVRIPVFPPNQPPAGQGSQCKAENK